MYHTSFKVTRALSGSTSFYNGRTTSRLYVVAFSEILTDDYRWHFSSTDSSGKVSRYRLDQVAIYHDGTVQAHAIKLTAKGAPYKSGIGLSMGDGSRYGQDIVEMIERAKSALVQLRNDDHASVMDNCCSGTGFADYAAVPCPAGHCQVTWFSPKRSSSSLRHTGGTGRVARVTVSGS